MDQIFKYLRKLAALLLILCRFLFSLKAASQNVGVISSKAKAALLYRCYHQAWFTAIILLIQPNTGTAFFMITDFSPIYLYFNLYTLLDEHNLTVLLNLITLPCVNLFPFVFTESPHWF